MEGLGVRFSLLANREESRGMVLRDFFYEKNSSATYLSIEPFLSAASLVI
jgi:hypothetical protein